MFENNAANILYVDNDYEFCEFVMNSFKQNEKSCEIKTVTCVPQALLLINSNPFDLYIFDYCLLEMTGAELCRKIRAEDRKTPVVIYSALYREIDRETAMNAGANAFIVKSDGFYNLSTTVRRFLNRPPVISRNYHSARRTSSII